MYVIVYSKDRDTVGPGRSVDGGCGVVVGGGQGGKSFVYPTAN